MYQRPELQAREEGPLAAVSKLLDPFGQPSNGAAGHIALNQSAEIRYLSLNLNHMRLPFPLNSFCLRGHLEPSQLHTTFTNFSQLQNAGRLIRLTGSTSVRGDAANPTKGLRHGRFLSLFHSHNFCTASASIFIINSQIPATLHLRMGDAMRRFCGGRLGWRPPSRLVKASIVSPARTLSLPAKPCQLTVSGSISLLRP